MTFVRNVLADLVAKRLWPVAAALVIALVAVPVLLGKSSDEAPAPEATASATSAPGQQPVVSIADEGPRGGRPKIGRNPFRQPGGDRVTAAKVAAGKGVSVTVDGSKVTVDTGGTGWGGDVPAGSVPGLDDVDVVPVGGSGSGSTVKKPAVKTDARDSYVVDLRFGEDGKLNAKTDVPRLSPLPSSTDPFFVFLGVLADGKTATFLVSSDAEATGDGKCLPSPQSCERVEMQAGDTEFFDVVTPDGETKQYQLDVVRVARQRSATAAVAAAARSRESDAGRDVLRTAVETDQVDVSDLAYSRDLGLVVPSGVGQEQTGSLFGGYRVDLQFGAPGALVKRYNLARLTPLPSVEEPSFVYLGVLSDGKTAIFLNPSEAASSGDGVCHPSPQDCQRVTLQEGQSALFDVPTLSGGKTQYQLDVDAISEIEASTPEEALASRTRESKAGRVILRRLINEVGSLVADLNFSASKGAVVKRQDDPQAPPTPGKPEDETTVEGDDSAATPGE